MNGQRQPESETFELDSVVKSIYLELNLLSIVYWLIAAFFSFIRTNYQKTANKEFRLMLKRRNY